MSRRSSPQSKLDEAAFPIRLKVQVPLEGFGGKINEMYEWLDTHVGAGLYATHGGGRNVTGDIWHVYFCDADLAHRFIQEQDVELADGTLCKTYRNSTFPFGR